VAWNHDTVPGMPEECGKTLVVAEQFVSPAQTSGNPEEQTAMREACNGIFT
jgi:hypothetical protein